MKKFGQLTQIPDFWMPLKIQRPFHTGTVDPDRLKTGIQCTLHIIDGVVSNMQNVLMGDVQRVADMIKDLPVGFLNVHLSADIWTSKYFPISKRITFAFPFVKAASLNFRIKT
jgi:hypothetical protein